MQDVPGIDLLETISSEPRLRNTPVVFITLRPLSEKEEQRLTLVTHKAAVRHVTSIERLIMESALFLHWDIAKLPDAVRGMFQKNQQTHSVLAGKKVLVVDDDVRNIFAMMSVLERQKMVVLTAETGRDAINMIKQSPDIDIVLMDIMMPAMDGYDTIREIRKSERFKLLPIIAVTAKAMKGDREKCIEAGATDYLAKPVDTEQLFSLLRVLLYN